MNSNIKTKQIISAGVSEQEFLSNTPLKRGSANNVPRLKRVSVWGAWSSCSLSPASSPSGWLGLIGWNRPTRILRIKELLSSAGEDCSSQSVEISSRTCRLPTWGSRESNSAFPSWTKGDETFCSRCCKSKTIQYHPKYDRTNRSAKTLN